MNINQFNVKYINCKDKIFIIGDTESGKSCLVLDLLSKIDVDRNDIIYNYKNKHVYTDKYVYKDDNDNCLYNKLLLKVENINLIGENYRGFIDKYINNKLNNKIKTSLVIDEHVFTCKRTIEGIIQNSRHMNILPIIVTTNTHIPPSIRIRINYIFILLDKDNRYGINKHKLYEYFASNICTKKDFMKYISICTDIKYMCLVIDTVNDKMYHYKVKTN